MSSPLRPELYQRLVDCFGSVIVANEGEAMNAYVQTDRTTGRQELIVNVPGEYYRVSCPFCDDTRHRLWINHRWGRFEPSVKSKNLFLAICYNENCLAESGNVSQLYQLVYSDFGHELGDVVLKGKPPDLTPREAVWPGRHTRVNEMWPNHPARFYLTERGFDVDVLARDFQVSYCIEATDEFTFAQSRIIVPVFQEGKLMGWQARCVGEPPNKHMPKYLTMPGMKKTHLLYNFDNAKQHPFAVVVEGVTDVWAFGAEAVGLFGKTISEQQLDLIARTWRKVYVVLDADALADARQVHAALSKRVPEVILVQLPKDHDPADLPTATLRDLVLSTGLPIERATAA
jgi:hypothetical protein